MIKIRIKGRLGNQLFIYCFARALCEASGQPALIYDRKDETDTLWHSHLDGFVLSDKVTFTSDEREVLRMPLLKKVLFIADRLHGMVEHGKNRKTHTRQMKHFARNMRHGLFLLADGYMPLPAIIPQDLFCDGYFQSARYFDSIRPQLLKELVPTDSFSAEEKEFAEQIAHSESVCLTIRLGDYLGNATHQVCTKKYYMDAMDEMKRQKPGCQFFVFSDEVEKARKLFDFAYPVIYDAGTSRDCVSLFIMAQCKHFIISNSSFSWWAQYLSQYKEKIVISPSKWYAQDVPCDIMQDSWIRLDC